LNRAPVEKDYRKRQVLPPNSWDFRDGPARLRHLSTVNDSMGSGAVAEPVAPPNAVHERLLALLRGEFQPLYAVLDAAREPSVLKVLFESKEQYQSLYEGPSGSELAHFAPYLIRLRSESPLLEKVVRQGWGKNWGMYLTSAGTLEEIRRHFRNFLLVKMPDGKEVYFRFYDPRVTRVFLSTCTPEDTTQLFGPIQNYLVEDETPEQLLCFIDSGRGSQKTPIGLEDRNLHSNVHQQKTKLIRP
jgi:hypothetical protein